MTNFSSIEPCALDHVTGGKGVSATAGSHGDTSSSSSALTTQLAGLQSSIKDLATQKPPSVFGGNTMLLFAVLASQRQQAPAANVVVVGGPRRCFW